EADLRERRLVGRNGPGWQVKLREGAGALESVDPQQVIARPLDARGGRMCPRGLSPTSARYQASSRALSRVLICPDCRKVSHHFPDWARAASLAGKVIVYTLRHLRQSAGPGGRFRWQPPVLVRPVGQVEPGRRGPAGGRRLEGGG